MSTLTPSQLAWRLAQDLPPDAGIWLGGGLPQLVAAHAPYLRTETSTATLAVLGADAIDQSGAFTTSESGSTPLPAEIWLMAPLFRSDGLPVLLERCNTPTHPTARAARLYTDVAIFEFAGDHVSIRALIEGITLTTLQMELDVELRFSPALTLLQIPAALGGSY